MDKKYYMGIDVGSTTIKIYITDQNGNTTKYKRSSKGYSGYYSHRTGHQKLRSRHPGLSVQCFLGKLCLHLPLYGSQFYPVRIPCHLCGNGHHLLLYQQHLHHADPSKRPAEGAGAKAHGSGERGHARQSPARHLA